jgi:hypothetical protein
MAVVNELGLAQADLANVHAFWGQVNVYNTPNPAPGVGYMPQGLQLGNTVRLARNAPGPAPLMPNNFIGLAAPAPNYGASPVTTTVDGAIIDLEALFIRLIRQMGVGGTMTNAHHMGPFRNVTPYELIVQFGWGTSGTVGAGHYCVVIPPNVNY